MSDVTSSETASRRKTHERETSLYAPVFPNQLLAVAWAASDTNRVEARENLMMCACEEGMWSQYQEMN
jgi:hypothetical protein